MDNQCIEHTGYLSSGGYGRIRHRGKVVAAHRLAYAVAHGLDVFTMGGHVMHSCDNRKCINPEHLTLADNAANMADKVAKGRQWKRLSTEQVAEIKRDYIPMGVGVHYGNSKDICAKYGITRGCLSKIVRGLTRSVS
uniref:Zinc-binding loop region of homing endonuclease domain-containing protein n=1 Tax=Pseudomonas phage Drael01 TaxID=3138533 RepID=A0AAU6W147_9VIRU